MATGPHPSKLRQTSPSAEAASSAPPAPNLTASTRWVLGLLASVAIFDLSVWWWSHRRAAEPTAAQSTELTLGTFEFNRLNPRDGRMVQGQFDVTLRLADGLDAAARDRISKQQRAMQRAAEAALERMRAADFTDPHLIRLKDRLLDRLNEALGFDAIDEVIVDNFSLERLDRPAASGPSASPPAKPGSDEE